MKIIAYEWDERNVEHIAQHSVTAEEVEEACFNNPLILKSHGGKYYAFGRTDNGRYLTVVLLPKSRGIIRVITARDMSQSERRRYARR